MNKLAIFVEGQTEQIFVERLIHYLGSEKILLFKENGFLEVEKANLGQSRLLEQVKSQTKTILY